MSGSSRLSFWRAVTISSLLFASPGVQPGRWQGFFRFVTKQETESVVPAFQGLTNSSEPQKLPINAVVLAWKHFRVISNVHFCGVWPLKVTGSPWLFLMFTSIEFGYF